MCLPASLCCADAGAFADLALEQVDEPQHVLVVGDAQVGAHLVAGQVQGADHDDDLDLVRLGLLGEDRPQGLGVGIGQCPGGDIGAVVGVAAQVGVPDAGDAQVLELVVLADGGEGALEVFF